MPNNPKIWHYHFEGYCFKQDLHVNTYIFDLNHLIVIFLQVYFLFWSTAILHRNYKNFWRDILEAGYTIKMFSLFLEWASWKTTEEISQWWRCFYIIYTMLTSKLRWSSIAREEDRAKRQLCADAFSHNERMQDFQFICNTKGTQTETLTFSSIYTQIECQLQSDFAALCNKKDLWNDHLSVSFEQESDQSECDSQSEYDRFYNAGEIM